MQVPGICPGIPGYCSLEYAGGLCEFDCLTGPDIRSVCTQDGTWDPYPTCDGDVRCANGLREKRGSKLKLKISPGKRGTGATRAPGLSGEPGTGKMRAATAAAEATGAAGGTTTMAAATVPKIKAIAQDNKHSRRSDPRNSSAGDKDTSSSRSSPRRGRSRASAGPSSQARGGTKGRGSRRRGRR